MKSIDQKLTFSFPWLAWPSHQKLLSLLSQQGEETRFIGGSIRDSLLQQDPKDFDCATTHHPRKVMEILAKEGMKVIPTGLAHGTVTAVLAGQPYQITTLRRDVETDGRRAKVAFTDSWKEDAARRDFTMNALSVTADGRLFDYFEGVPDLEKKCVRFIGLPAQRIQEDYLRILRFFRFQTFYGGDFVDHVALDACIFYKNFLTTLARERITQEFLKILEAPSPLNVLRLLEQENFFPLILEQATDFPLIEALLHLEKAHAFQTSPLVRLGALLGRAETVPRLCLSNNQAKIGKRLSQAPAEISAENIPFLFYRFPQEIVKGWVYLQLAEKRKEQYDTGDEEIHLLLALEKIAKEWTSPVFPLDGRDVLALGAQGKKIKELLEDAQNWWLEGNFSPDRNACLAYLKKRFDAVP